MHLLTAAHDFYPDPGSGGSGRYVYETSRRLVDRGHRVSVVTRRRGEVPRRETVEGVEVYRYDLEVADRPATGILGQLGSASAAVAEGVSAATAGAPPDVFSVQGPVTGLLVGRNLDSVPVVPTFHSPWPVEYCLRTRRSRSAPRRCVNAAARWGLQRGILAAADRVVTLSEFMRRTLDRVYGPGVEVCVVPGGVDAERFSPAEGPGEHVNRGDPAFLTVRRLSERMGHGLLLAAFSSVVERHPPAHLYVAGDGPLRDRLERRATDLGLDDHVTFLGYVPDRTLPALYADADVFVLPTTELEGFGLATLEALAAGTPAVGTPVGGTVEVLSAFDADPAVGAPALVPSVDAPALAEAMCAWSDLDGDALARAGAAARRHATERFSWRRTVRELETLYRPSAG